MIMNRVGSRRSSVIGLIWDLSDMVKLPCISSPIETVELYTLSFVLADYPRSLTYSLGGREESLSLLALASIRNWHNSCLRMVIDNLVRAFVPETVFLRVEDSKLTSFDCLIIHIFDFISLNSRPLALFKGKSTRYDYDGI